MLTLAFLWMGAQPYIERKAWVRSAVAEAWRFIGRLAGFDERLAVERPTRPKVRSLNPETKNPNRRCDLQSGYHLHLAELRTE